MSTRGGSVNRTREALIDVAARLLDEGGTDAVTLRQVGHGAGVSHNAPYKHFAGKEALLAAVAARELQGL
ncbi:MAG: helix-turn-helix transcriptional regulator, partial [Glycomyces artemisiae]|nr:helix-turn-helix transcriptional regulator [Glycomyces artemisiae]